jgi:phosphate transport system permease protein
LSINNKYSKNLTNKDYSNKIFKFILKFSAIVSFSILVLLFVVLLKHSYLAIKTFKLKFFIDTTWDPVFEKFGALPFVYGTLLTSFLALIISAPISISVALFLSEFANRRLKEFLGVIISLLAAIPSVIYGLVGIFVLAPLMRGYIGPGIQKIFGFLPFFQGSVYGLDYFTASIVLSIMITPTITSISTELFDAVPKSLREASLALGATKWEMIKISVLKTTKVGIIAALLLGLGRAIGETMAVTMVIGNIPNISLSLFSSGATLASVIANEFTEATSDLYLSSLYYIGLVLLLVTLALNLSSKILIKYLVKTK